MKPILYLPPAAALAAVSIWLISQQRSISAFEKETLLLREHLTAVRHAEGPAADPSLVAARNGNRKTGDLDPIDWKALAGKMAKGGNLSHTQRISLREKLSAMSGPELNAALAEIAVLGMSQMDRGELKSWMLLRLKQKAPELYMDHCMDRIHDSRGSLSWEFPNAFEQWAGKDPAAATAWFTRQIAAGKFESKSLEGKYTTRLDFEARLLPGLLAIDPAAVKRRITALPEDQRKLLFQQGYTRLQPGSEKSFTSLVREYVPEKQQPSAFTSAAKTMLHQGGYEKVGKFLDDIEVSPAERRTIATNAASYQIDLIERQGGLDMAAVVKMREWMTRQSPDEMETTTGRSLVDRGHRSPPFEKRLKIIEDLHAQSGSDELLIGFLDGNQLPKNREASLVLAAKINDETKRAKIVKSLSR